MRKNSWPGLLVDIEGLDGSGSSTQVSRVAELLRKHERKAHTTKEPTDNLIGGLIRGALTGTWQPSIRTLQYLFIADRSHHLEREIEPALKQGVTVITDRYAWSTVAFGSTELDSNWLLKLHDDFILPDLTFLLRVPADLCIERIKKARFEVELFEEKRKLERVWQGYLWLARKFPRTIEVIDGTKPPGVITRKIGHIILDHPKFKHQP